MIVARVLGLDEFWELPAIPAIAAAADKPSDDDTVAAAASDSEATEGLFWSSDDEPVDDEPLSEPQQSALALVEESLQLQLQCQLARPTYSYGKPSE